MTATQTLTFAVPGLPVAQGSMRHVGNGRLIHSPHLTAWRALVGSYAVSEIGRSERQDGARWPATGPVQLTCVFYFPRPKNHYRQGKFAHMLRSVAPVRMQVAPDLDKLVRAIGDALTSAAVILDDKQIDLIYAGKQWTTEQPKAVITVAA